MSLSFARLAVFVTACMTLSVAARAASVNPFDPALPPEIHAFASCNFTLDEVDPDRATCTHARIAENPVTLTQIAGVGTAEADLSTGTLRAHSTAAAYRFGSDNLRANASAVAQAYDTISFPGGYTGQVGLRMTVPGRILESTDASPVSGQAVLTLFAFDDQGNELGQASLWIEQYTSGGAFVSNEFIHGLPATITTNADAHGDFATADVAATISMTFDVGPAQPELTFGARVSTSAALGPFIGFSESLQTNDFDFGDGAELALVLPENVPWTSSSGVFLPEPVAPPVLAAGVLGLALGMRRRRPSTRDASAALA